jgi:hypothetical protein
MDFNQAIEELSGMRGELVLFAVRQTGSKYEVFEMLDRTDQVRTDEDGVVYVLFHDVESSVSISRAEFDDAAWEPGWRPGEQSEKLFRVRVGDIDPGFSPS